MITNYGQERAVGEVWIDSIDGAKVITVAGDGCKDCAFATLTGGACSGAVYDRHPCCAADRKDGRDVYFSRLNCRRYEQDIEHSTTLGDQCSTTG